MRKSLCSLFGSVVATVLLASSAHGATVTAVYSFDTTFSSGPYGEVKGTIGLTYDTAFIGNPAIKEDLTVDSFTSNLPSTYGPFGAIGVSGSEIFFGRNCTVASCPNYSPTYKNYFRVNSDGSVAGVGNADIFLNASDYFSTSDQVTLVSSTVTSSDVPEPAPWAMMVSGFGLIGGALRRRAREAVGFA